MHKLRHILVCLALLGLVAGCSGIPTSGPVIASDVDRADQVDAAAPYVPRPPDSPDPGADQVEIVQEFLRVSVAYAGDVNTVREYLTPGAAEKWEPSDKVTITVDRPDAEATNGAGVSMSYTTVATTSADGSYSALDEKRNETTEIEMSRVDGEWRIANPPDGVIMSESDFDFEFERHYRYFFDPTFSVLVPEPIYLPKTGITETLLAKSLLSGPSPWLEPAVKTAFADGAELAVQSVPVDSGTAEVELTSDGAPVDSDKREQMAAQLAWTLTQAEDVAEVNATLDGGPLFTDEPLRRSDFQASASSTGRDSHLYALDDRNRLVVAALDGGESEPVEGPFGSPTNAVESAVEFAVDLDGSQMVALSQDRTHVLHATRESNSELTEIADGSQLSSLIWDRTGLIWMLENHGSGAELRAMRSDGKPAAVAVRGRIDGEIEALSVSPDGTKMAMVVDGAAYVGVVVPTKAGADVIANDTNLLPVAPPGTVLDVSWADATTVALLVEESNEDPEPHLVEISSREDTSLGSLPQTAADADSITAASPENVAVGTAAGQIWANHSRTQWTRLNDGSAPAYPG